MKKITENITRITVIRNTRTIKIEYLCHKIKRLGPKEKQFHS